MFSCFFLWEFGDKYGMIKSTETLIKAFPAPDFRRKAAYFFANLCASAAGSKEVLI